LIPRLGPEDYEKDEKQRSVTLTEEGVEKVEQMLMAENLLTAGTLYDIHNVNLVHHVNQALRAHKLYTRDVDYIVKDDKVVIIDEFTGRMMDGRRWSDGLHQAVEAKEHQPIQNENQTLASITFQNYFRLYPKLAGMTGTAMTEAGEFQDIYKLEVIEIPTNLPVKRLDDEDEVYRTEPEKFHSVAEAVKECFERKQPVLVGTVSIEKSEALSTHFKAAKIPHQVLNARYHEMEALIVAQAGRPGAVTIATNMAGRGTDIQLGGNLDMRIAQELGDVTDPDERARRIAIIRAEIAEAKAAAIAAGGLMVIGSERHESRRIDNQLRGRSGRQGDPGASKFFVSLQDDLMRIFGSERMDVWLQRFGIKENEAIVHPWMSRALEKAQQKVEARNFDIRKQVVKYDDVMNDQRKVIYEQRKEIMNASDVSAMVTDMRHETIAALVSRAIPEHAYAEQWDVAGLNDEVRRVLALDLPVLEWAKEEGIAEEAIQDRIREASDAAMREKEEIAGADAMRNLEKNILLRILDQTWKDHLLQLDHLRQGIHLRGYAQRDPLNEYKREAFQLFEDMLTALRETVTQWLCALEMRLETEPAPALAPVFMPQAAYHETPGAFDAAEAGIAARPSAPAGDAMVMDMPPPAERIARNAPCPCGSGKKFKHCHGRV
jgi:preprotein translocase subunit SecA